jgi:KDO2-lipid IV(A) lauroyltransferase
VVETFQQMARSIFDLYRYARNAETFWKLLVLDTATQLLLQRPEFSERGLMIAGLHISNFDLVLQALARRGVKMMVLTIPNPQGGRRMEFEMRRRAGLNLLPASVDAFRQALKYLQTGGVVLTGIDRPADGMDIQPDFFGRPAMLPTHHIFLAARAQVPVMLISTNLRPDGKYQIFTSDRIEMDHYPDRESRMKSNAEKVLGIAEGFIRRVPQQWSMSLPVWPQTLDLAPT